MDWLTHEAIYRPALRIIYATHPKHMHTLSSLSLMSEASSCCMLTACKYLAVGGQLESSVWFLFYNCLDLLVPPEHAVWSTCHLLR
jgi:hypothetical protein